MPLFPHALTTERPCEDKGPGGHLRDRKEALTEAGPAGSLVPDFQPTELRNELLLCIQSGMETAAV